MTEVSSILKQTQNLPNTEKLSALNRQADQLLKGLDLRLAAALARVWGFLLDLSLVPLSRKRSAQRQEDPAP